MGGQGDHTIASEYSLVGNSSHTIKEQFDDSTADCSKLGYSQVTRANMVW